MKFVSMLAGGRMDDDGPILAVATDFSDAETMPMQLPSGLVGTQIDIKSVAFKFGHCCTTFRHCRAKRTDCQFGRFPLQLWMLNLQIIENRKN